jgi:hypothetical protein
MEQRALLSALCTILLALALAGCDVTIGSGNGVPSDLRGTWECTEATSTYVPGSGWQTLKGTLVITYTSVTISGPVQHLEGYTKDIALEARAEEGLLYIKDTGEWKSPIAYRCWQSADYKDTLVTLTGGGAAEEPLTRVGGRGQ